MNCGVIRFAIYVIRVITNTKGLTEITATATTQALNIVPDSSNLAFSNLAEVLT